MKVQCFMLSPLPILQVNLRRYTRLSVKCPATEFKSPHDAMIQVEDKEIVLGEDISARFDHSDARWPKVCRCGYEFVPQDVWQVFAQNYYERVDDPTVRTTLRDAAVGAMWDAQWYKGLHEYGHKDGRILMVRTPGGDWCIDGPSNEPSPKRWTREGDPPNITVQGSIRIGDYHGVLTSGFLEDV